MGPTTDMSSAFPVQYRFPTLNRPSVIAGANIGMVKTEHSVIDDDDPLASSPRRAFGLFRDHSLCSRGLAPTSNPAFEIVSTQPSCWLTLHILSRESITKKSEIVRGGNNNISLLKNKALIMVSRR
jgi:hypothetical protein